MPKSAVGDPEDDEDSSSPGTERGNESLAPVAGAESQSLRNPGPIMVAALISISGHGPAVTTV